MKLKSFSLLEVLVGIVISGIVISAVYSVYFYSNKQYLKFIEIKAAINNYFEFNYILNNDFEQAEKIIKIDDFSLMMSYNYNQILYFFNNDFVVRVQNNIPDTFNIQISEPQFSTIKSGQIKVVDYIEMKIDDEIFSLQKNYGSQIKFKDSGN